MAEHSPHSRLCRNGGTRLVGCFYTCLVVTAAPSDWLPQRYDRACGTQAGACWVPVLVEGPPSEASTCLTRVELSTAFRDVMRVKTSAREGSREVYILREFRRTA